MASLDSPNADSDVDTNPNSNSNSSRAIIPSPSPFPTICLLQFAENSIAGALMGSILGYGSGLFKRKGFKGSFADAGASAKTFAAFSGVHGLVICLMKRLRGKHDIINSGVAGCCTGLAISIPGAPQALLQSCLMYGAFSCIMEGMNKQQPALAHSLSVARNKEPQPLTLALPLSLPIPEDLKNGFSSFLESLKMAHKGRFPTAN